MAYANVVSLLNTITKLLRDHQDPNSHENQQINFLYEKVTFLQSFLDDYPEKLANNLEARIRDASYEAEETIERFMSDQTRAYRTQDENSTTGPSVEVRLRFDLLKLKLEKVTEKIDLISREAMEIKNRSRLTEDVMESGDFQAVKASSSSSMLLAPTRKYSSMVGFDDDLMEIKIRLAGESSKLQFIPIFGMGGIGKTTLARNAFDDQLVGEHFHIRAWVTVSQDYSAHQILSSLWFSVGAFNEEYRENDSIQEKVYKSLKGRRYLIVLDDMWTTKEWDDVRRIFPDDDNGSRIMLTTRLYDMAVYPDSSGLVHEMRFMDADQSWDLLTQKVFAQENCPPELESIGKTIAASCSGLPLAIVLIAGLLAAGSTRRARWESIASNVSRAVNTTNDEQFTKILSLSYIHLPHHLRPCFLYFGGFPEDYEIRASKLIKLWVAEGFLKPNESKSPEEVAEEYLEDLVKRSLVLVTKRKSNGKIKSCSIHDLVRDSCIRRAQEDKFLLNVRDSYVHLAFRNYIKNWHRVGIAHADRNCMTDVYDSSIRTILDFRNGAESPSGFLGNFRLLRVLNVVGYAHQRRLGSNIPPSLPVDVCKLFSLTYIAFDHPMINIPVAIANLHHLQTLIIQPPRRLVLDVLTLPSEIWKMPQLRHLIVFSFHLAPYSERAAFALESLLTLSEVVDFVCAEKILRMVPNLKKLGISFVSKMGDYQLENLVHLHQLEKLKLRVHWKFGGKLNPIFPASLKKLVLSGEWGFSWDYFSDIVGSLPNLEVLKLRDHACNDDAWETREGGFLRLQFLSIEKSKLRHWITESSHFPRLKCLVVLHCWYLLEIPGDVGEIPTLEQIKIDYCHTSVMESAKRIQKERKETWGDDALQLTADNREVDDFDKKVVLKVDFSDENIERYALQSISSLSGLKSVALDKWDKKLTAVGDMDPVVLGAMLRQLCPTEILFVGPAAKEKMLAYKELWRNLLFRPISTLCWLLMVAFTMYLFFPRFGTVASIMVFIFFAFTINLQQ